MVNANDRTLRLFHQPSTESEAKKSNSEQKADSLSRDAKATTSSGQLTENKSNQNPACDVQKSSEDTILSSSQSPAFSPPFLIHKLQDLVNRHQWLGVCFNSDGEYIVAGSETNDLQNIYIWDKNLGNLIKILEGPKESLVDLCVSFYKI